jgi:Tfp pilus assembly protein PilX
MKIRFQSPRVHRVCRRLIRTGGAVVADQRGVALVLSLVMLVVLSLLGILALNTSDTELSISGNQRAAVEAFYSADRAVEYVMGSSTIRQNIDTGSVALTGDHATRIAVGALSSGLKSSATNRATYVGTYDLPKGSGFQANVGEDQSVTGRYYAVEVTGAGPRGAEVRVCSEFVVRVPGS